ncbi:transcription termination factor Rho [Fibrobacter sp. UWH6]|uniref:transcription termination factor Rho n=1 Tax=Fibrobacter sp. (strain UWH6) TaxID=1896212 RepID=UPI000922CDB8|nr:transcription termination factor Rho [Fibrobacter sp. UWH6]SHK81396.1 transcription termination factor Rho [Fibrobacter sp. UWH6]
MAPIKKTTKSTHLADQESTGMEVPAELREGIELPVQAEPAPEGKPAKRAPRAKAAKNDDEKKANRKVERIKEKNNVQEVSAEKQADTAPVETAKAEKEPAAVPAEISAVPAAETAPATDSAQNADGQQAETQATADPSAAQDGTSENASADGQQRPQQKERFNKYDKKNKFNKFDKNNRNNNNNNRPQQQEEQEDTVPMPDPDSEAWCKARDCWAKYRKMTMSDLQELASQKENLDFRRYRKQSLGLLLQSLENENNIVYAEGLLEVTPQGHGFLRNTEFNYQQGPDDVYVSQNLIRRFGLKVGDTVAGLARPPRDGDKFYALRRVDKVNFDDPEKIKRRVAFEYLTPIHPNEKINLEWDQDELTTRVMDLFSPIGKGQRSIILAPPRTGKTILLQNMTRAIAANHPECIIMVLLIDERPEEVTEMREIVGKLVEKNPALKAEVVASTFDEPPDHHARVATMVLEKAKRLVEQQKDVVVLLDSITRFARANNVVIPHSGKILSGGVDAMAMQFPKKFFGAARKIADKLGDFQKDTNGQMIYTSAGEPVREVIQKNGSLTIIGTALIETGSRMDEVIFEEFKGTGNMELVLDRRLAEKRTWPAIDIFKSGTRKEDRLLSLYEQNILWSVRQSMQNDTENGIMDKLIKWMKQYKSNADLLEFLRKAKDSVR